MSIMHNKLSTHRFLAYANQDTCGVMSFPILPYLCGFGHVVNNKVEQHG